MNELVVIAEGETEQTFVRDQLAGHLALHGVNAWAVLPGRNRRRGGVKKWDAAWRDIVRTLKEGCYCTTMFDFYAMPNDWPGRADAAKAPWQQRADLVEEQLALDIAARMGAKFNPKYFIPYVQLHEFEALAFADVGKLASVIAPLSQSNPQQLGAQFAEIVDSAGHPEAIDDGWETCPSRRINGVVSAYRKRIHGAIVTDRIGLSILRQQCGHFASWLERLEAIGE